MTVETTTADELAAIRASVSLAADLREQFYPTDVYKEFQQRLYTTLEFREASLKRGGTELKGVALIGPPGTGKTRMTRKAIGDYATLAEADGGRKFGHAVVSVTVPGKASMKETCKTVIRELGYEITANRDEGYLFELLARKMEEHRVAALHLDEVQDVGKHDTKRSALLFAKRFRSLMQNPRWPICLILTGTMEAKGLLNADKTLARRCRPVEIPPMDIDVDGPVLRRAIRKMLQEAKMEDDGLIESRRFQARLIHAARMRFGMALEIAIEAIEGARFAGDTTLTVDQFAEAYYIRTNADDDRNPFIANAWKAIDTTKLFDRITEEVAPTKNRTHRPV